MEKSQACVLRQCRFYFFDASVICEMSDAFV